jgi:hypothetical protein
VFFSWSIGIAVNRQPDHTDNEWMEGLLSEIQKLIAVSNQVSAGPFRVNRSPTGLPGFLTSNSGT